MRSYDREGKEYGTATLEEGTGLLAAARVENTFFRYESIIGNGFRARTPEGQVGEVLLACNVLNQMTELAGWSRTASVGERPLGWVRYEIGTRTVVDASLEGDVRVRLAGREHRPDHAGRHEVLLPGTGPADGAGCGDRLSRSHRPMVGSEACAQHPVRVWPRLRSSGGWPVPPLMAREHVSGRRWTHSHRGSRVLRAAARHPWPAGEPPLRRCHSQKSLRVPRCRNWLEIWSVLA